jgi:hypothetical protein
MREGLELNAKDSWSRALCVAELFTESSCRGIQLVREKADLGLERVLFTQSNPFNVPAQMFLLKPKHTSGRPNVELPHGVQTFLKRALLITAKQTLGDPWSCGEGRQMYIGRQRYASPFGGRIRSSLLLFLKMSPPAAVEDDICSLSLHHAGEVISRYILCFRISIMGAEAK